jgi:hypothetical protein
MSFVGLAAMGIVGLVLGLIGGGGAILTMPILVYLFATPPSLATSYSLFVVGIVSVLGVWRYHLQRLVEYRTGVLFVLPSFVGTYVARHVLLPSIPEVIFDAEIFRVSKDQLIMAVFALVMLAASTSMIKTQTNVASEPDAREVKVGKLVFLGFLIGFVAGFVGAGGGFLIIPALVVWGRIPMTRAVATSLFIIAANSLVAFVGDLLGHVIVDWLFLGRLTAVASLGLMVGVRLSPKISPATLKVAFGWLVLVMGGWILVKQLF